MNDKERMQYYLTLLEKWQKCLSAFFKYECPSAPPGGVRVLLDGLKDVTRSMYSIVDSLDNKE